VSSLATGLPIRLTISSVRVARRAGSKASTGAPTLFKRSLGELKAAGGTLSTLDKVYSAGCVVENARQMVLNFDDGSDRASNMRIDRCATQSQGHQFIVADRIGSSVMIGHFDRKLRSHSGIQPQSAKAGGSAAIVSLQPSPIPLPNPAARQRALEEISSIRKTLEDPFECVRHFLLSVRRLEPAIRELVAEAG